MKRKNKIEYLGKAIILLLAILPIIYFNRVESVPVKAFILGTGSWGIGNIFKILFHQIVLVPLENRNKSVYFTSLVNGLLSGIFELSASYLVIYFMKDSFVFNYNAIISFGLAIGSLEMIIVVFSKGNNLFKGTTLEKSSDKLIEYLENRKGIQYYTYNLLFPIVERIIATFIHISTRGLVFITIITGNPLPVFVALLVFIIADGILGYRYHITGKLATGKGYIQIHLYLLVLAVITTVIFCEWISPYKNMLL